jgi:hypothetical protein
MDVHAIIMLPLHPSVHLAHDVFDGMSFVPRRCAIRPNQLLYLTLPYLTLPYLTLPYLTLPYLTLPYLSVVTTLVI